MSQQKMHKFHFGCLAFFACLTLLFSASVVGAVEVKKAEKETSIHINQNVIVVSGRMSLGLINGVSNELVYVQWLNHKISELNWDIDDVYMMGLGGSVVPLSWLKLNADVWFRLNKGNGSMEDYDWLFLGEQYTLYSRTDSLDLTRGIMFDFSADLTFYNHQESKSKFYGIIGFKHDTWKWEGFGGYYNYYGYTGDFGSDPVIVFEQNLYAPYVGFGISSSLSNTPLSFSGRFIYSPLVYGDFKDQHLLRNLVFEADFDDGSMFGIDVAGAYNFTDNFSLILAYQYQNYSEMKSRFKVTDVTTGVVEHSEQEAGMDNYTGMVSLTAQYSF